MIHTGGCRTKRSTDPCFSKAAAACAMNCLRRYAPAARGVDLADATPMVEANSLT